MNDYIDDLQLLEKVAREAGELSLQYWKQSPEAWNKPADQGPVSEADLAVNDFLESHLRGARPAYGWLSEESVDGAERLENERVFIIDPIDGTRAFLGEDPGFGQSVAVAENGRVIAGVVHMPALDLTYTATLDGPALLNGAPIQPSKTTQIRGATVLTSKLSDDPGIWLNGFPGYERAFRPSMAWRLCLVAEGRFDATISMRKSWEWDVAAASLIAERAGVRVTNRLGEPFGFNRPECQEDGLVVAPPELHADFMAQLRN
ncbi:MULTISPECIES: 3'(2'),5'-bisphosphate nucleotidase CysQ [Thioclava]|uniref:3'(2'),5'-bisphosphate nucleotidase CysQ n=1 Tax=Thioclava litoralis TaxID=3076557 RepID=A0ABZ1E1T1_9RHOB|nr:3'(2'),5'-bisphosphate nucleotidase CysQ [Thioclava sp. FTW29]